MYSGLLRYLVHSCCQITSFATRRDLGMRPLERFAVARSWGGAVFIRSGRGKKATNGRQGALVKRVITVRLLLLTQQW